MVAAAKLLDMAEQRWRRLDGHELLPLVRAGVKFADGQMEERKISRDGRSHERLLRSRWTAFKSALFKRLYPLERLTGLEASAPSPALAELALDSVTA